MTVMCVPTNGQLYVVFCKVLSAPHDRGEKHSKKSHHYVYYNIYIYIFSKYVCAYSFHSRPKKTEGHSDGIIKLTT